MADELYEDNSNLPYSDNEDNFPQGIKHDPYDSKTEMNQMKLKNLKRKSSKHKDKQQCPSDLSDISSIHE